MSITEEMIRACATGSHTRFDLWSGIIQSANLRQMAEVGVLKGDFAAEMLRTCESLTRYYMIDPWRHLDDWNKPANTNDDVFGRHLSEALAKTEFAANRRIVLRGKTTGMAAHIDDGSLDFAYIDGDHTLRGITTDLICMYPKIRDGGILGGDDFTRTVWQHHTRFEPTLVFPFAVYFAEATGARIYALPHAQFLIEKTPTRSFAFVDLTNRYDDVSLRNQFLPGRVLGLKFAEMFPRLKRLADRVRHQT